ncbi:hypothetical protein SADUNF_Sadunf17G0001000 [Salix dunnii]|uniref:Uncharacterized protein n=1 Tax=Salix dunnii TaxID=1413687 RepID=A0A835J1X8_9ROSI|nr:hypothetical protein SADUNF_Sadunf17G0001000 [Salix dunnii]
MKNLKVTKESLLMGSKRINLDYYPICPNPELTVELAATRMSRHSQSSSKMTLAAHLCNLQYGSDA